MEIRRHRVRWWMPITAAVLMAGWIVETIPSAVPGISSPLSIRLMPLTDWSIGKTFHDGKIAHTNIFWSRESMRYGFIEASREYTFRNYP